MGLRAYRAGEDARAIQWTRSASLGQLVARERSRDTRQQLHIDLDEVRPGEANPAWEEGFERSLCEAASLAADALAHGRGVEIRTRRSGGVSADAGEAPDSVWRFLARLKPEGGGAA